MGKKKTPAAEKGEEAKPEPAAEEPKAKAEEPAEAEDTPILKELKALDGRCLEVEKRFQAQVEELRKKCFSEQAPIFAERAKVLAAAPEGADGSCGTPALKGFWLQALKHSEHFEDQIEEWDAPVLEYLSNITSSYLDADKPDKGFKLEFHFVENPYFSEKALWKEYHLGECLPWNGETSVAEIKVCEIDWNDGKDVTVEVVKKKAKGGGAKKKVKAKSEPRDSFFRHCFRHLKQGMPVPEDMNLSEAMNLADGDDEDEVDAQMMEYVMENDHEMGREIRDHIIPFAVRWYTGEAAPKRDLDSDDEDGEDGDGDEDDEDEDGDGSEEEEEEEAPPAKGKKAQAKQRAGGGAQGKQEECKQQ